MLSETWGKKYVYEQLKAVWAKYPTPSNIAESLVAPELNPEIKNLLEKYQVKSDMKFRGIQKSLIKWVSATLHLNDIISKSDLSVDLKTDSLQTCIDVTAIMSQASTEMSIKRRGFCKAAIQPDYKDLCSRTQPITKNLFGDNVTQDMKDIKMTNE